MYDYIKLANACSGLNYLHHGDGDKRTESILSRETSHGRLEGGGYVLDVSFVTKTLIS